MEYRKKDAVNMHIYACLFSNPHWSRDVPSNESWTCGDLHPPSCCFFDSGHVLCFTKPTSFIANRVSPIGLRNRALSRLHVLFMPPAAPASAQRGSCSVLCVDHPWSRPNYAPGVNRDTRATVWHIRPKVLAYV